MSQPSFFRGQRCRLAVGFTILELLVSVVLLAFLMIMLVGISDSASRAWCSGQRRADTMQTARASLELFARELTPAQVDTRLQFVIAPGSILAAAPTLANNIAPQSPVTLWMAPLGTEGALCCVGYYLYRDDVNRFYRLKRLYIPALDSNGNPSPYFPRMVNINNPRDPSLEPNATDATWFTRNWDINAFDDQNATNTQAVTSTVADGVIALWVRGLDPLGHAIPLVSQSSIHPASSLYFNSAAYFEVATTTAFDNGGTFAYEAKTPQSLKANRVPAAVEIAIVLLDQTTIAHGVNIPQQTSVYDASGALDLQSSIQDYTLLLNQSGIHNALTFTTRAKLVNGN
jgi:type II secretory pathway pseudopilin PulG